MCGRGKSAVIGSYQQLSAVICSYLATSEDERNDEKTNAETSNVRDMIQLIGQWAVLNRDVCVAAGVAAGVAEEVPAGGTG